MANETGSILAQLLRTTLLVGLLGIGLYLALAVFSRNVPAVHLWLALLLGAAAAMLVGTDLRRALRTGRMALRGGEISAGSNPIQFGLMMALWLAATLALLALLIWVGWGLVAG